MAWLNTVEVADPEQLKTNSGNGDNFRPGPSGPEIWVALEE